MTDKEMMRIENKLMELVFKIGWPRRGQQEEGWDINHAAKLIQEVCSPDQLEQIIEELKPI